MLSYSYDVPQADTVLAERDREKDRNLQRLRISVPLCVDCWKQRFGNSRAVEP